MPLQHTTIPTCPVCCCMIMITSRSNRVRDMWTTARSESVSGLALVSVLASEQAQACTVQATVTVTVPIAVRLHIIPARTHRTCLTTSTGHLTRIPLISLRHQHRHPAFPRLIRTSRTWAWSIWTVCIRTLRLLVHPAMGRRECMQTRLGPPRTRRCTTIYTPQSMVLVPAQLNIPLMTCPMGARTLPLIQTPHLSLRKEVVAGHAARRTNLASDWPIRPNRAISNLPTSLHHPDRVSIRRPATLLMD